MEGNLGSVGYFDPAEFFPVAMTPTLRSHRFPKEEMSRLALDPQKRIAEYGPGEENVPRLACGT